MHQVYKSHVVLFSGSNSKGIMFEKFLEGFLEESVEELLKNVPRKMYAYKGAGGILKETT